MKKKWKTKRKHEKTLNCFGESMKENPRTIIRT